jgi:hypothetical protein
VRTILQLTRAIIGDSRSRRSMMFYSSLGSVVMVFVGAVVIDGTLRQHLIAFVLWWAACAWLMLASLLLAVFDILLIRAAGRRARRDLARTILKKEPPDETKE